MWDKELDKKLVGFPLGPLPLALFKAFLSCTKPRTRARSLQAKKDGDANSIAGQDPIHISTTWLHSTSR